MKISFITPHLKIRGANRRIIELSNNLISLGHSVTIFHSDGRKPKWLRCRAKVKPLSTILKIEHNILIDTNRSNYPLFKNAKAHLKIFYVLLTYPEEESLLRGFHLQLYLPYNRLIKWYRALLYDRSILKLSCSTGIKDDLNKLGVNSELLFGGVNFKMFYPPRKIKEFDFTILSTGNPLDWKGEIDVVNAIEIVKKNYPKTKHLTYFGKGIPQNKMAEFYHLSDIFVDAQWYGGWNNPVAEAMACKVPTVCTNIGSVKDIAFHNKTAILSPPRSPSKIAQSIIRLFKNHELRDVLRDNAYSNIRKFTWNQSAGNMIKIIKNYV